MACALKHPSAHSKPVVGLLSVELHDFAPSQSGENSSLFLQPTQICMGGWDCTDVVEMCIVGVIAIVALSSGVKYIRYLLLFCYLYIHFHHFKDKQYACNQEIIFDVNDVFNDINLSSIPSIVRT